MTRAPRGRRRSVGAAAAAQAAAGGGPGPILSTQSLRSVLPADVAATLGFGTSPDGTPIGPDDFATTGTVTFTLDAPSGGNVAELQADAELGADRNAVVRLMITDRPEGSPRDAVQRVLIGDPASAGYQTFRAGIAEYVALLPPNSHGEANPADKDPVPPPFDNTYNSPEHDAFVLKVKYQRNDELLHREHRRRRRSRPARSGVERSLRLVAVPRCLPRHARRSLRPDAEEPSRSRT